MEMSSLMLAVVLMTAALPARSTLGLPPPRSYLARQVLVWWRASGQVEWIDGPGTYELRFPCAYARGAVEVLSVEVAREAGGETPAYRECAPQEVRRLAEQGAQERVRFSDIVMEVQPGSGAAARAVTGSDGRIVIVGAEFVTAQRVRCLVSAQDGRSAELIRAVVHGDEVTVEGWLAPARAGEAVVIVDGVRFTAEPEAPAEPPWNVTVRWMGQEVAAIADSGDCPVVFPCVHGGAGVESATLRLRHYTAVDLLVGGRAVRAELADTPEERSWGLQGRPGLGPDEGMLFFFELPLRPIFAMRSVSFPIAVAFIAADGTIVSIEKLTPGDAHGVTSPVPVNYVLEMEQAWFEENGVKPGDAVTIP